MFKRRVLMLSLAAVGAAYMSPASADIARRPSFIRVETGEHVAAVTDAAVLEGGKWIATASADKTIRIRDAKSGKLKQVLYVPQGRGLDGYIHALAAAGPYLAAAVFKCTTESGDGCPPDPDHPNNYRVETIYLYKRDTEGVFRLVRHMNLPSAVPALAMDKTGKRLAAALLKGGVWIYDTETGNAMDAPDPRADRGKAADVAFDPKDGKLAVSFPENNEVCLFRPKTYKERACLILNDALIPGHVAFHPLTENLAVAWANENRPGFAVLNTDPQEDFALKNLYKAQPTISRKTRITGTTDTIAFSADGRYVFTAGDYRNQTTRRFLIRMTDTERYVSETVLETQDIPAAAGRIMRLRTLPGAPDKALWTADTPERGTVAGASHKSASVSALQVNFNGVWQKEGFAVSPDGMTVNFRPGGPNPVRMSFRLRSEDDVLVTMTEAEAAESGKGMRVPVNHNAKVALTDVEGRPLFDSPEAAYAEMPKANGVPVPGLTQDEEVLAADVDPDPQSDAFVLATEGYLRYYEGGKQKWLAPADGSGFLAAVITEKNRMIVTATADGALRWFARDDGRELAAARPRPDGKAWILWNPEGYFRTAGAVNGPDSKKMVVYLTDQGDDREPIVETPWQRSSELYRPDLVLATLNQTPGTKPVEWPDPAPSAVPEGGTQMADVNVPPAPSTVPQSPTPASVVTAPPSVPAPPVLASSEPEEGKTKSKKASAAKGKLFILSVGVGEAVTVNNEELLPGLKNAAADARSVAETFAGLGKRKGSPFSEVTPPRVLTDKTAGREAIMTALSEINAAAAPEDTVLIYFAGHGVTNAGVEKDGKPKNGKYYFASYGLPESAGRTPEQLAEQIAQAEQAEKKAKAELDQKIAQAKNADARAEIIELAQNAPRSSTVGEQLVTEHGLSQDDIMNALQPYRTSNIALILDTCQSGNMADAATNGEMTANRISLPFVLAGAATFMAENGEVTDQALDGDGRGSQNGMLAVALLAGLAPGRQGADENGDALVDVLELFNFAKHKVIADSTRLHTKFSHIPVQKPAPAFPRTSPLFALAPVDETAKAAASSGEGSGPKPAAALAYLPVLASQ